MVSININGNYLDLPEDFRLQFSKTNTIFDIGNIKTDRTTEFDVPATDNNNNILGISNNIHTHGDMARIKLDAQLQYSGVVIDGYIVILEATRDKYSLCFFYGNNVRLKSLFDNKKLSDLFADVEDYILNMPTIYTLVHDINFGFAQYENKQSYYLPSVSLRRLLRAFQSYIIIYPGLADSTLDNIRFIPNGYHRAQDVKIHFHGEQNGENNMPSVLSDDFFVNYNKKGQQHYSNYNMNVGHTGNAASMLGFKAIEDIDITIPQDVTDKFFVIGAESPEELALYGSEAQLPDFYGRNDGKYFFGGYYFNTDYNSASYGVTTGEPLTGKTISIPAGTVFQFVQPTNYETGFKRVFYYTTYEGTEIGDDWKMDLYGKITLTNDTPTIERFSIDRLYLKNNVPDMTVMDFLKFVALKNGKDMHVVNGDEILMDNVSSSNKNKYKEIDKIIDVQKIKRGFKDYKRNNIVKFPENYINDVSFANYEIATYEDETKLISEFKFNNGKKNDNGTLKLYDLDYKVNKTEEDGKTIETIEIKPTTKLGAVAYLSSNKKSYAYYGVVGKSFLISKVTAESTEATIKAYMPALEYLGIEEDSVLIIDGGRYMWTTSKWSNNVVTFEVCKA